MLRLVMSAVVCGICALSLGGETNADNRLVTLGEELRLPLPDGWEVANESAGYPFRIINGQKTAELLIYRSIIGPEESIKDEGALREAVDLAVEEVIYGLPDAVLLTNTGYYRGNHAAFALDFTARDSVLGITLHHRLMCLVYGHPQGHQLLFTLWGKVAAGHAEEAYPDMVTMQDGLRYTGSARSEVFPRPDRRIQWLLVALLPIAALLLIHWRRQRTRHIESATPAKERRPERDAIH